jgi:hypothetical protein
MLRPLRAVNPLDRETAFLGGIARLALSTVQNLLRNPSLIENSYRDLERLRPDRAGRQK